MYGYTYGCVFLRITSPIHVSCQTHFPPFSYFSYSERRGFLFFYNPIIPVAGDGQVSALDFVFHGTEQYYMHVPDTYY